MNSNERLLNHITKENNQIQREKDSIYNSEKQVKTKCLNEMSDVYKPSFKHETTTTKSNFTDYNDNYTKQIDSTYKPKSSHSDKTGSIAKSKHSNNNKDKKMSNVELG
eukprot:CAMPEP_0116990992 /NCGR_PEP_ID=MMETSP0467-20121206/65846_1 /TAXON_ID=283647 /ORGANISM="Mesodinium pulex, Strain SPMC105" /LENGTH=107 /DNA_ID=CAMNT_0004687937 /DNA_START=570 /DNA_END=893 /DNA_ORIENTATION=-